MPLKYLRLLSFVLILGLLFWFIGSIREILLPFVFGILIAYLFDPLADKLERVGCSRSFATAIVLGCFFLLLSLAMVLVLPPLIGQVAGLISDLPHKLVGLERKIRPLVNNLLDQVGGGFDFGDLEASAAEMSQHLLATSGGLLATLLRSGMALANLGALIVIAPVVSFYFLRDYDTIVAKLDALLPRYYAETIRTLVREMDHVISGFLRGQLNVCLALAIFYAIALSIAGLKYALLLSLLAGILIIIPYAGTFISGLLSVSVAFFTSGGDWTHTFTVMGIFVAGQLLEGYVFVPKLMGRSVGLHPMWIIFGMLAGGALMGFVGVLIAVPLTAVIGVLVRAIVRQYLSSPLYSSAFLPRETVMPAPASLVVDPAVAAPVPPAPT